MQPAIEHGAGAAPDFPDEILDAAKMPHPITTSTAFDTGDPAMNIMFDRLFATPMSWLLAVPIVLLDRLMSPELIELPGWDPRAVPQRDADRCEPSC
ncbi:hypothetical protein MX572_23270 (plasmid) [Rhodococcus pyridinivorans]|uniref:hypothetical protein n=1 Tax=Rhodococcus pyridinivorans TaxID=103816 RepID=UPI0020C5FB1C|nr:hypothetical protein [Rhodococcus pyridinivorans]UTM39779.1 hypothetical protein MX572_23270 [Rhodococcus pyridinivorans]